MRKKFLRIGSLLALVAVALGAIGAHSLEGLITTERLETFETGVRYQFYHSFAILLIGVMLHFRKTNMMIIAGWLFLVGIILFSGSIYLISFRDIISMPMMILGPMTPVGGVIFMAGWACFIFSTYQQNNIR